MITEIFIVILALFLYRSWSGKKKDSSRLPSGTPTISTKILLVALFFFDLTIQLKPDSGPGCLPLLGNMLDMKRNGHLKLSEWAETYGSLFTVRIGTKPYEIQLVVFMKL